MAFARFSSPWDGLLERVAVEIHPKPILVGSYVCLLVPNWASSRQRPAVAVARSRASRSLSQIWAPECLRLTSSPAPQRASNERPASAFSNPLQWLSKDSAGSGGAMLTGIEAAICCHEGVAAPQWAVALQIDHFWAGRSRTAHWYWHWPRCGSAAKALFLAPIWIRLPPSARPHDDAA